MDRRIHEYISIIFSAPFIALYILLRIYYEDMINTYDLLLGLICLTILPIIIPVYYAHKLGVEWDYPERVLRIKPFMLIVLVYMFYMVYSLETDSRVALFISASYFLNGLLSWLITFKYKVSIHMVGIFGPATLMYLLGVIIDSIALYIVGFITGVSRYLLNRHNTAQLITGVAVSISATTITYLVVYGYWGR